MNPVTVNCMDHQSGWHSNSGYTRFYEALMDGRLKAGMTLTQSELSKTLDLSLSPLRETLVLLEDYRLVEIKPRAGVRIFFPDVTFIRDNMQYRSMIELFALHVFIRNVDETWMINTRSKHGELLSQWQSQKSDRNDTLEELTQALDREMHGSIVEALGNQPIRVAHRRTQDNVSIARKVHQTSFGKSHYVDTIGEHLRFLDAVEAMDSAGAGEALEAHFRAATHRLFIAP